MANGAAAAAAAVHPSAAPPPARQTVAWSACARLASTAVICLFLASMWIVFCGMTIGAIGLFACRGRRGCAVFTVAINVAYVAAVTSAVAMPFCRLVALMAARAEAAAGWVRVSAVASDSDIEATKVVRQPALKKSYAALRDELREPFAVCLSWLAFALLVGIGMLITRDSPAMGSRRETIGSVIYLVGVSGMTVGSFVLWPLATVRVWRAWKKVLLAL